MCEGSIFHRNFPEINGLEGGEGVKDAAGSFSVIGHNLLYSSNRLHQMQVYVAQMQVYIAQMQVYVTQMSVYIFRKRHSN